MTSVQTRITAMLTRKKYIIVTSQYKSILFVLAVSGHAISNVCCVALFASEWRQEELMRIDETLTGAERKAALCMLLDQETQLLASIGRHKLEADAENREKFIQDFLEKVGTESPSRQVSYFHQILTDLKILTLAHSAANLQ